MNRGPFIFLGVFAIVALSWALLLVKPSAEGHLTPAISGDQRIPALIGGLADHGREVYQELGCVVCHTQQVRAVSGRDITRGWGDRQTVALDYIDQSPVFTGNLRIGPDLSNVGARRTEREWHLRHLYDARIQAPGSNMPSYAFLFEKRRIVGQPSNRALNVPTEAGYEIIPSPKAEALAAYMLSLTLDYDIREAPAPEKIGIAPQ